MFQLKIPHTFTIVFAIIVVCAIITWIVPGGKFERETKVINGAERSLVVADSFEYQENEPQTWQVFTAMYRGFNNTSSIIVFILMIGGGFWILNTTNAINVGIFSFLKSINKFRENKALKKIGVNNIIIVLVMILFSLFGAVFGMSEETIAFIIIFVPLSISMGYDSIVGVLICYVAAHVGFAGAMLNPFTVGIAQGFSALPPFSGLEYRFLCWIVLTTIAIVFTLWYAQRIKKNPEKSPMFAIDKYWRDKAESTPDDTAIVPSTKATWLVYLAMVSVLIYMALTFRTTDFVVGNSHFSAPIFAILAGYFTIFGLLSLRKSVHAFILQLLLITIVMLVVGVLGYHWYVMEIAGLFFAMGILSGIAFNQKLDTIIRSFLEGCKDIMTPALIVGLAGGIIVILEDGKVIDTILFSISQSMENLGRVPTIGSMYMIQNLLNVIIPSGSAKAALTIPMMAEFSDIIGISRQLTVLAFQFGDGFTNMITPTSGVLIGCLGVAKIPYATWIRFIFPFIIFLIVLGFVLLLPPLFFPFNGF